MRVAVFIAIVALGGLLGYSLAMNARQDAAVAALTDTLRITDSVIVVRTDTVTVRQKVVTRWDSVVQTITDTQVVIIRDHGESVVPDTVTIPPEVIAKDRAKDALIAGLYAKDSTQEWRIATRDQLYQKALAKANAPRWGVGATIGYGCLMPLGCGPTLNVGLTWQAKLPRFLQLLR